MRSGIMGVCCGELLGLPRKAFAALLRRRTLVPLTCSFCRAVRACHQLSATIATPGSRPVKFGAALHHERMAHAGHGLDLVEIGADDLAAKHRALLENGTQHAREA